MPEPGGARPAKVWPIRLAVVSSLAVLIAVPRATATDPPAPNPCASNQLPERLSAYPRAVNTGVPATASMSTIAGDFHTKVDGQVVDQLDIHGRLYVDNDNVKVKCSRARLGITNNGTDLKVWLSTLGDARGSRAGSAVKYSDYTLRRVNVMGTIDGLKAEGDVDVRDSYIHDMYYTRDSTQDNGWTHNDAVQISRGSNMVFRHNTIYAWSFRYGERAGAHLLKAPYADGSGYMTSAFMVVAGQGPISDVTIGDNIIRGRTSKYVNVVGRATGVKIVNNRMGRENRDYPKLFGADSEGVVTIGGNVFYDGGDADY